VTVKTVKDFERLQLFHLNTEQIPS